MINRFIKRITPPGYKSEPEIGFALYIVFIVLYSLYFVLSFAAHFGSTMHYLYVDRYHNEGLIEGAKMFAFGEFTRNLGWIILPLILLFLLTAVSYYRYFTKSTNSIYLMKRIEKKETVIRCLGYPLLNISILIVALLIDISICLIIYFTKTPPQCLPDEQYFALCEVILWSK